MIINSIFEVYGVSDAIPLVFIYNYSATRGDCIKARSNSGNILINPYLFKNCLVSGYKRVFYI